MSLYNIRHINTSFHLKYLLFTVYIYVNSCTNHVHIEYNTLCLLITRNNGIMYVAVVCVCMCVHVCACVVRGIFMPLIFSMLSMV